MDNSYHQQETDTQKPSGSFFSLRIFDEILNWLVSLIQLTEEEQDEAGIYIGNQRE